MQSYNLDDDVEESFPFTLGGHTYSMRYPTTEEVFEAQKITDENDQRRWVYSFITSTDPNAPPIEEALNKANVKKAKKFNEMITSEFFLEG